MTGANQEARHALQKRGEKSILKNLRSGAHNVPDLAQIKNEYIYPQNKKTWSSKNGCIYTDKKSFKFYIHKFISRRHKNTFHLSGVLGFWGFGTSLVNFLVYHGINQPLYAFYSSYTNQFPPITSSSTLKTDLLRCFVFPFFGVLGFWESMNSYNTWYMYFSKCELGGYRKWWGEAVHERLDPNFLLINNIWFQKREVQ